VEDLRRWLWRATLLLGAVLVATGAWLSFFYRPFPPNGVPVSTAEAIHTIHWVVAALFVVTVVILVLATVVAWNRAWLPTLGLAAVIGLSLWSGRRLPWDQLALRAVTVGTDFRGLVTAAFDDQVKFVIVGSREISQATIRAWFAMHALLLPVVGAGLLVWLRRRSSTVGSAGV
jgi:quinol-cytochrome oxidoreductase complex cytochrome b subunit